MPAPPTKLIPTRLDIILLAIQARLVASLAWPPERVLIVDPAVFDAKKIETQADSFLCLWPDTETATIPIFEGASRQDTRVTERFLIEVRTRVALDEPTSRLIWLTDGALGHIVARHAVYNALIGCNPLDNAGNALTIGPITPANGQRPRPATENTGWGRSSLAFDVRYILALDLPPY